MQTDIIQYYRDRAKEFEKVYWKEERQEGIAQITRYLQAWFQGKSILEVACGTGFWTERIAHTSGPIHSSDVNPSVLDIARAKTYASPVAFETLSWEDLNKAPDGYQSLFGGFIWSHILKEALPAFVEKCLEKVPDGGLLVFVDNTWVPGNSTPIHQTDPNGNTFQLRTLENGEDYLVLKNYFSREELEAYWRNRVKKVEYFELEYFWLLKIIK
ncbi:MAG: methyltransferase domain-containing protein [Lewinellaceae bacterium]|nr:methyltransferase domain-containing protein [Lewinellaceae bacterium]